MTFSTLRTPCSRAYPKALAKPLPDPPCIEFHIFAVLETLLPTPSLNWVPQSWEVWQKRTQHEVAETFHRTADTTSEKDKVHGRPADPKAPFWANIQSWKLGKEAKAGLPRHVEMTEWTSWT